MLSPTWGRFAMIVHALGFFAAMLICCGLAQAQVTDCTSGSGNLPSSRWTAVEGQMAYVSFPPVGCYDGSETSYEIYTGTSFTAGQYSQAKLLIANGGGVAVRMNSSGSGYIWWPSIVGTNIYIVSSLSGVGPITMTTPCPNPSTGDTIQLSVNASYNFICTDLTTGASGGGTDSSSTYTGGSPGIITQAGGPVTNFQAGDVGSVMPAATPAFSPAPGHYTVTTAVTLTDSTSGAVICYTTDGSAPTAPTPGTCSGGTTVTYSTPISISSSTTIKAIATLSGNGNSSPAMGAYTIGSNTWYIQPNGGPRYSATYSPTGDSCNGLSNANLVVGGGPDQTCAWNDPRYVWADGSAAGNMAMAGGDTLMLAATYPSDQTAWRFAGRAGPNSGNLFNNYQGAGGGDPYTDYNLNLPAGTPANPTRILGANYAACGVGQKTYIFGGYASLAVLNLQQTHDIVIQCLDITDHSDCIKSGTAGLPSVCSNNIPLTDYANSGIMTVTSASGGGSQLPYNITIQDVDLHGFPHSGLAGAIGGPFTLTRVTSNRNGFAGWDFDFNTDGVGEPNNPAATINAQYVTMDWNGCNEEYPQVDPIPITYCYSITNDGFGDAWSGQDSDLASMTCNHCEMAWNVKDAFFGPHTAIASVTITNSNAYNNGGQTWKANLGSSGAWLQQNTLTNNNCRRLQNSVTGAPSTFNIYIASGDLCRADGAAIAIVLPVTGSFELDNNTFVSASSNVAFDFTCWSAFATVSVGAGGTGYSVNDVLYVGGTQATVTVTSVGTGGVITGISLATPGQVTSASVPFTETYIYGGTGRGAQITINTITPVNCGAGPRILRNNNFIGYTNTDNPSWNGSTISAFCYSSCNENPGTSTDAMWTTRSKNNFYGYTSGADGACTYVGEICASPQMVVQPSLTWTNETQLDSFTPSLSSGSNSFYPASGSPLIGSGTNFFGIPELDYYGVIYSNPPPEGAVMPASQ